MFLVMGITGKVGGATAETLLAQGKQVRALVRNREKAANWNARGVELVDGDWNDASTIAQALDGVEGAYFMMPPIATPSHDFKEAKALLAAYVEAFEKAAPPRLVALSSLGSEKTSGLGNVTSTSLMEQAFSNLPFPIALIRAGYFYENFLYGLQVGQSGVLPTFCTPTSRRFLMVATRDIGAVAAKLLTGPGCSSGSGKRIIELGSMVSPDEVADQLGRVLAREVKAQAIPREAWAGAIKEMGLPEGQTWAFEELFEGLNSGWINNGVPGTEQVEGTTLAYDVFTAMQKVIQK